MSTLTKLFLVATGGAIGALLRYAISGLAYRLFGTGFPWGTLSANLLGCFLIGFCWALSERITFSPHVNPFLFTGLIGAFTTFSTYGLESLNLMRDGEMMRGLANILASNVFGVSAVFVGFVCARFVTGLHR